MMQFLVNEEVQISQLSLEYHHACVKWDGELWGSSTKLLGIDFPSSYFLKKSNIFRMKNQEISDITLNDQESDELISLTDVILTVKGFVYLQ